MADMVELITQLIQRELAQHLPSHIGVVEVVQDHADGDHVNYGCDVRLRGRDALLEGVPVATDHLGTVAPPAKGDLVLVQFVEGDPDRPVICGRFYSDQLRPPAYAAGEIVTHLPPQAADKDRVDLIIKGGKQGSRSWTLKLPADITIAVTDTKVAVLAGNLKLTLDKNAGEVSLQTSGAVVKATDGGDVTLTGASVKIEAKGALELKAGGQLALQATGNAVLKGAVVQIN